MSDKKVQWLDILEDVMNAIYDVKWRRRNSYRVHRNGPLLEVRSKCSTTQPASAFIWAKRTDRVIEVSNRAGTNGPDLLKINLDEFLDPELPQSKIDDIISMFIRVIDPFGFRVSDSDSKIKLARTLHKLGITYTMDEEDEVYREFNRKMKEKYKLRSYEWAPKRFGSW